MSDAGTNFVSDRFQQFCMTINVEQAVASVYTIKATDRLKPVSNL